MKKLLYITTHIQDSGGVSRVLSVKLNYLIEKFNYDIYVIETNRVEGGFFYDFNSKIKFQYISVNHLLQYRKELNLLVNAINPDVIVNCDNGLKGALLSYLLNIKVSLVYERHCSKNISSLKLLERLKLKLSNSLLENNSASYKSFVVLNAEEKKQWKGNNIQIIPNPLWFNPSLIKKKNTNKIAVAVGRHAQEKGYDKLIHIWEVVVQEYPDWVLKIYGEKDSNLSLEQMVKSRNLQNNIHFFDPINDIESIYAEADFLLSTSRSEAFGLVLIEAMSFGIPVIAFNGTSGTKSIVNHNENGFLIQKNDILDYAEKVKLLIGYETLRFKLGASARASLKTYDLEAIMKKWNELFESI